MVGAGIATPSCGPIRPQPYPNPNLIPNPNPNPTLTLTRTPALTPTLPTYQAGEVEFKANKEGLVHGAVRKSSGVG